jgi:hypothetical protein
MRRRRYIAANRIQLASWMPWLARLETLMSIAVSEVALQQQEQEQKQLCSMGGSSPIASGHPRQSVQLVASNAARLAAQGAADIAVKVSQSMLNL